MKKNESSMERLVSVYNDWEERLLEDFFTFLRFQSISSEPEHRQDMLDCAFWLKKYLEGAGFDIELWEGSGHPTVFAGNMSAGSARPTVMIYNHYDVQPVDPLDLWETPPFDPAIRKGEIYARGAQDNKGQTFFVLNALKALLKLDGKLPVNVKLCIDGEEESGSGSLASMLEDKKEDLLADYLIIADGGFGKPESPAINLGARGLVSITVEVIGSKSDLHSGAHGGIVYNPNHALVEILAKLRDERGKITVPGFYDHVLEATSEEKEKLNLRFDAEQYESMFGAKASGGEKDYSPRESNLIRPTLEINGLGGGYTGAGFKTVIPARAEAKISCRLVPDQDPSRIGELVSEYIRSNAPEGVTVKVRVSRGSKAFRTTSESRIARALSNAYNELHDTPCRFHLGGGTIPIAAELVKISGAEAVLMGYGLGLDNVHAPNEHFGLDRLKKGFLTIARGLEIIAA